MSQRQYDLYADEIFRHLHHVASERPPLREGLEKLARACLVHNGPQAVRTFRVLVHTAKRFKTPTALLFLRIQANQIATGEEYEVARSKGFGSWLSVAFIATIVVVAGLFLANS